MTLGAKIQKLRESRELTQKKLAEITGVTTGKVAEWEADEVAPDIMELAKLSKALSVSSDELLESVGNTSAKAGAGVQPTRVAASSRKGNKTLKGLWIVAACLLLAIVVVVGIDRIPKKQEEAIPFSQDAAAIEKADASVVTIFCYDYDGELAATGSGFVAFNGKTIVTNYHVMTSAYTCKISTNQDISYNVTGILCYSKEQDIAVLQLAKDTGLQPLTLGDSGVIKKGESVVAIGSPLGIKNTVSSGILSGRRMEDNMDVLQFTAPISQGSSGGALFDDNGNVIGITYASYIDGQNLNLAIPIELVNNLYNAKGVAKSVSAIYIEHHPYHNYYEAYHTQHQINEVSIEELLNNPSLYNEQYIKVTGYFSSSHRNYVDFSNSYLNYIFIAPATGVTGNGEIDYENYIRAFSKEDRYRSIKLNADNIKNEKNFLDPSIEPGDKVCLIGLVHYSLGSSLQFFDLYDVLIYSCD